MAESAHLDGASAASHSNGVPCADSISRDVLVTWLRVFVSQCEESPLSLSDRLTAPSHTSSCSAESMAESL
jgi:hypothetical protein